MKKKIWEIVKLIRAKHYALLLGDSEEDIAWAIESLNKADQVAEQRNTPKKEGQ